MFTNYIMIFFTLLFVIAIITTSIILINHKQNSLDLLFHSKNKHPTLNDLNHSFELYGKDKNNGNPSKEYVRWYCNNEKDDFCENSKNEKYIDIENIGFTQLRIADYYVLSSFNTCVISENYKRGHVHLDGLKNAWTLGAKFFDFEVYNIDDKPIIGCNLDYNDFYNTTSTGEVLLLDVFEYIKKKIIEKGSEFVDPIFIHLRIKTMNQAMYDKIAKMIELYFKDYLYPFKKDQPGNILLSEVMSKVVIMCQILPKNKSILDTKNDLYHLTNIHTIFKTDYDSLNHSFITIQPNQFVHIYEYDSTNNEINNYPISSDNLNKLYISFPKIKDPIKKSKLIKSIESYKNNQFNCIPFQIIDESLFEEYLNTFFKNDIMSEVSDTQGNNNIYYISYKQRLPKMKDYYMREGEYDKLKNIGPSSLFDFASRPDSCPTHCST